MKRKPIIVAFALLFVVSAALWGVNWRLDNPPLTKADRQFREAIAGADAVRLEQAELWHRVAGQTPIAFSTTLNATQTHNLLDVIHLTNISSSFFPSRPVRVRLTFMRQGKKLGVFSIEERGDFMRLIGRPIKAPYYELHPRSVKRVRRILDEFAPNRSQLQ